MALINPYPLSEHPTYVRSYLRQMQVSLHFSPISNDDFQLRAVPFIRENFDLDISKPDNPENNLAEIKSQDSQTIFHLGTELAEVIIGPETYKNFVATALPRLDLLGLYVCEVIKNNRLDSVEIIKYNEWPFSDDNIYEDFTSIINFTFAPEYTDGFASYKFGDKPEPTKLTKSSSIEVSDLIKLDTHLEAEAESKELAYMRLFLRLTAKDVSLADFMTGSTALNDIMFYHFKSIVTPEILDLMSREKLQ